MGFFSNLKSSPEPSPGLKPAPANPAQSDFAKVLNAAVEVMTDFGAAMEIPHPEDGIGPYLDEKHLPHGRETILWAYDWIQKILASDAARAAAVQVLAPGGARYFLSEKYASALRAGRATLDLYVPGGKLGEQRANTAMMGSFLESLSPEEVAKQSFLPGFPEDLKKVKKP